MAGSRETFLYEHAGGGAGPANTSLLVRDESNMRALGYEPTLAQANPPPTIISFTPRYILLRGQSSDGQIINRRIDVLEEDNDLFQSGGVLDLPVLVNGAAETITFRVTGSVGETRTFRQFGIDTGQTDGTNP